MWNHRTITCRMFCRETTIMPILRGKRYWTIQAKAYRVNFCCLLIQVSVEKPIKPDIETVLSLIVQNTYAAQCQSPLLFVFYKLFISDKKKRTCDCCKLLEINQPLMMTVVAFKPFLTNRRRSQCVSAFNPQAEGWVFES